MLDWFTQQGWQPFDFQNEVWQRYLAGESGLIHSPTGTGKTYAAWLGALAEWLASDESAQFRPTRRQPSPGLQVLWITPLRALAVDTAASLLKPVEALGIPWTIETRTGDTSSSTRQRQRRRLPAALVTTPESLSLILTWDNATELLAGLKLVVVDEWHELLSSKRGVQTELGLARLRRLNPGIRLWGLSATMGNLPVALRTLLGTADYSTGEVSDGHLIEGSLSKQLAVDSIIPPVIERFPWAGHLGMKLLPQVVDTIDASATTLVFCNTRNQVERWYQAILEKRPDWAGWIAMHHSSIAPETRGWVEEALRQRRLKCVVCTSSLDLGVDFPEVDAVLQISSPKGVARLMQRAGRSGHRPGEPSRVICVPAHAFELVEISAARLGVERGELEARPPIDNALDVLVQHLVTVGLGGGFVPDELYREVRTAYSYRDLSPQAWQWAVDFVTRGGDALSNYDQYHRVEQDSSDGRYEVTDKRIAQMHRMSIGTIVGDTSLQVQYLRGPKIGQLEESFVSRLNPGDRFTLGGKVLEFVRLQDLKVWVRRASGTKGVVPRWAGGRLPLSETLTRFIRQRLDEAAQNRFDDAEMQALQPIFELQARISHVPRQDELLIERVKTREGHHLFFYPFGGRLVHEGMAALLAYRLSRLQPITFTLASNDYGFELLSPEPAPLDEALAHNLFDTDTLIDDIIHAMNASEMARRQFRDIARVSGLVMPRYPGGQKTIKQLQMSSSLLYDVLSDYDSDNLLLEQARREVLSQQLEAQRLHDTLVRIDAGTVLVQDVKRPTPFSFPLLVDRMRHTVSSETLEERIAKMVARLEKWAG